VLYCTSTVLYWNVSKFVYCCLLLEWGRKSASTNQTADLLFKTGSAILSRGIVHTRLDQTADLMCTLGSAILSHGIALNIFHYCILSRGIVFTRIWNIVTWHCSHHVPLDCHLTLLTPYSSKQPICRLHQVPPSCHVALFTPGSAILSRGIVQKSDLQCKPHLCPHFCILKNYTFWSFISHEWHRVDQMVLLSVNNVDLIRMICTNLWTNENISPPIIYYFTAANQIIHWYTIYKIA
jgi:hypothetical protein